MGEDILNDVGHVVVDHEELPAGGLQTKQQEPPQIQAGPRSTAPAPQSKEIALSPEGLLVPSTQAESMRIAEFYLRSGALPKQFENAAQVFMAMQYLRELGFQAISAIRQCAIINGALCIWGDLPLAAVRKSGLLEWIEEKLYTIDYKEICFANQNLDAEAHFAVCRLKRRTEPTIIERVFSVKDAQNAKLLSKPGPWMLYRRRMLQSRTRSWALKDAFPEILSGMPIAEYDHNVLFNSQGQEASETNVEGGSVADDLNKTYLGEVVHESK